MSAIAVSNWPNTVCDFWFEELGPDDWFKKSDTLDAQIEDRFGGLHAALSQSFEPQGSEADFLSSPTHALGAIIVFDQFSRNLFRGDARSFASDPLALGIARAMVASGWDKETTQDRRVFVYLPFEHSEEIADQNLAVRLIEALGDDTFTRFADAHREVIKRFGRFPHRNAILGRTSTPAEEAYLSQPGSGF